TARVGDEQEGLTRRTGKRSRGVRGEQYRRRLAVVGPVAPPTLNRSVRRKRRVLLPRRVPGVERHGEGRARRAADDVPPRLIANRTGWSGRSAHHDHRRAKGGEQQWTGSVRSADRLPCGA